MEAESENVIEYKWNSGVYSLEDMIILVKYNQISKEQFFKITRYNYDGVIKNRATN